MKPLSFKAPPLPGRRYQIRRLYFRFSLSLRDAECLLAERGIEVIYETIRCWTKKFGPLIARRLKKLRPSPSPRWHLNEVVCRIGGRHTYLWRAVDDEGEVLELLMQRRRDTRAARKFLERLLRGQPVEPATITTDGLASYLAALRALDLEHLHLSGRFRENNRAENSHLPARQRERRMQGFKNQPSAQRFCPPRRRLQHFRDPATSDHPTQLRRFRTEAHSAWSKATA